MREVKLKIVGGEDFVIITPQMLAALISRIHSLAIRELIVSVEDIVPRGLEEYLAKIINTNRYAAPCFRFSHILEDPITREGLHQILRAQLEVLEINQAACFQSIVLTDTINGEAGFDIACTEPFFWACKDAAVRFVYTGQDGGREILVLEYG